jgi:hypothetical protein
VEGKGGGHFTSREISWKKWIKLSLSGGGGIGIHYFLLNSPTRKLTSTGEKISYVPLVYDFPANLQKEKGLKTKRSYLVEYVVPSLVIRYFPVLP